MKPIFTQLESESILNDITPQSIMTTTSMSCLASKLSQQTADILLSLKSPKKIIEFMRRKAEEENIFTVYFMVFFVKSSHAKRGQRCFLFLNSLKELSLYHTALGTEEKYGIVSSLDILKNKQKLVFRQENGQELTFKIKSDNISDQLYDAVNDFFNEYSKPYQDLVISFMHLPKEQVEMFLPLKESFRRMINSIDLDFITKTSQLELNEKYIDELGQIIYTLFSNYDSLLYASYRLIYISVATAKSAKDLFKIYSVFNALMSKWIHTSRFDFYQNAATSIKKLYSEIFVNENDINDKEKKILFYESFLNELKLGKSFSDDLMTVAKRIFYEVQKKFPDNKDAAYFSLTRVFITKGLEEIIGDTKEFSIVKELLEFKLNEELYNSVIEKLKFSLREIAALRNKEPVMPKMNAAETNKEFLALQRFIFENALSLSEQLNAVEFSKIPSQLEIFLTDLLDVLKNSHNI